MNFKRKEFWIPTLSGLLILLLVAGILIYRNFFRAEEWRLYDQIKSKSEWAYKKLGRNEYKNESLQDLLKFGGCCAIVYTNIL